MKPPSRRLCLFAAVAIGLVGVVTFAWRSNQAKESRRAVIELYQKIQIGMPASTVQTLLAEQHSRVLKGRNISPETMLVETPLEWGAGNWLLWLELRDGRVAAARIRLQDSRQMRPQGAPDDKE